MNNKARASYNNHAGIHPTKDPTSSSKYRLRCLLTGDLVDDEYTIRYRDNSLLRSEYQNENLTPRNLSGLWKWVDWLPVTRAGKQIAESICYKSERLGEELGLSNLWISLNGYFPERRANCPTTTFKDLEAVTTLQRLRDHNVPGLICASAGNTARAFAYHCGLDSYPVLLVIAEKHLHRLWVPKGHPIDSVNVIGIADGSYNDAIDVTSRIWEAGGWRREGGVHNVARRDGIGSLLLTAINGIGTMPDHYFQGVGGGPGPIGVHEMALRAVHSGMVQGIVPKQHLSQNESFCPVHRAWQTRAPTLIPETEPLKSHLFSDFLVNETPAYSVCGGLYDILSESQGETYSVSYTAAAIADEQFLLTEGIDIHSPGAVALASLKQACEIGNVESSDCILLNISGAGQKRFFREHEVEKIQPVAIVCPEDAVRIGKRVISAN